MTRKEVSEEQWFYLRHHAVRDLHELEQVLQDLPEDEFHHHVNEYKNDFAAWTQDVFGDRKLAAKLREVKDKKSIMEILRDHHNTPSKQDHKRAKPHERAHHRIAKASEHAQQFILADFIYGLIVGLIIGIILARVLFT